MPLTNAAPVKLIVNTHSRKGGDGMDAAVAALHAAGLEHLDVHKVNDEGETKRLLKDAVDAEERFVVVGGGDGTLSSCAAQLVGTKVALAVLPMGTGNTLARSLGLPVDVAQAARAICGGRIESVDVGKVNDTLFLNSVTLGLSAELAHALTPEVKKHLGLFAWPVTFPRVMWGHHALHLEVASEERSFTVRTHQLVVCNGRYVAGPVPAAPDASIQDGALDVFVLGGSRFGSLARTTLSWLTGRQMQEPAAHYFTTSALQVSSLRAPIRADVDGEITGKTPLEIRILPRALRVVVPQNFHAATA